MKDAGCLDRLELGLKLSSSQNLAARLIPNIEYWRVSADKAVWLKLQRITPLSGIGNTSRRSQEVV
jgi:hypothetical protein